MIEFSGHESLGESGMQQKEAVVTTVGQVEMDYVYLL